MKLDKTAIKSNELKNACEVFFSVTHKDAVISVAQGMITKVVNQAIVRNIGNHPGMDVEAVKKALNGAFKLDRSDVNEEYKDLYALFPMGEVQKSNDTVIENGTVIERVNERYTKGFYTGYIYAVKGAGVGMFEDCTRQFLLKHYGVDHGYKVFAAQLLSAIGQSLYSPVKLVTSETVAEAKKQSAVKKALLWALMDNLQRSGVKCVDRTSQDKLELEAGAMLERIGFNLSDENLDRLLTDEVSDKTKGSVLATLKA